MSETTPSFLTDAERQRFIEYLTHEAFTARGIIEQMERIKSPEIMISHFKREAAAFEIVRNKLATTETFTVGR